MRLALRQVLEAQRVQLHAATRRFKMSNLRVFGSVLHGTDREGSDIDLLVDASPETTLWDLGGLQVELEALLGVSVDLLTPASLLEKFRAQVLAEARPL